MNNVDKICKETLELFSFSKEQLTQTIVSENSKGTVNLSEQDLSTVISLINTSLENSFQRGFSHFQAKVDEIIQLEATKKSSKK